MIVYWSMIGWVLLIYFIYSISHKEELSLSDYNFNHENQNRVPIAYMIVVFGYILFWVCIRKSVADTITYISVFQQKTESFVQSLSGFQLSWSNSKAPLFNLFNSLFKTYISDNYTWWLTTIAIISTVPVMVKIRNYSQDFFLSTYLFMTTCAFFWLMNGMRQFICVGILFGLCDWIKDGKKVRFIFVVLILSLLHMTCLLMIPVYFFARTKPWKWQSGVFVLIICLVAVFSEPFFSGVDDMLGGTSYSGTSNQISSDSGINPLRVVFFSIPAIFAFIKRKTLEIYYERYPMISICVNMALATAAFYFVGMFTSGIFIGRIPIYCELYNLILVPYMLQICFNKNNRFQIKIIIMIVCLLFFYFTFNANYDSEMTGWIF